MHSRPKTTPRQSPAVRASISSTLTSFDLLSKCRKTKVTNERCFLPLASKSKTKTFLQLQPGEFGGRSKPFGVPLRFSAANNGYPDHLLISSNFPVKKILRPNWSLKRAISYRPARWVYKYLKRREVSIRFNTMSSTYEPNAKDF